jgi:putative colanic acid biosysnthesis UDP-glucose lipid carrier transferase
VFSVWKFRSMYVHDEDPGIVTQATDDDERVTPVGRFLRATSIDELPQLFNVLTGTMSLVGPRPHAMVHNNRYSAEIAHYMCRHRIKPGITGLAQIRGHRGNTEALANMQARVASDIEYINNWSLSLDLWILLMTPYSLLKYPAY